MLLLEQDNTRKRQVEIAIELNKGKSKKYNVEAIRNSAVYARESEGYLSGLYYLVTWKSYSEKENT